RAAGDRRTGSAGSGSASRTPPGHAQRLPALPSMVLGQIDDLPDVLAVVHELAVDRIEGAEPLAADEDGAREVLGLQRVEGGVEDSPALLPTLQERRLRGEPRLELAVAVAVGLLAVGREEVGPPRTHVAGYVLNQHGDAVRFRVQSLRQLGVVDPGQRPIAQGLQLPEPSPRAPQELGADVAAAHVREPSASHSPPNSTSTSPT